MLRMTLSGLGQGSKGREEVTAAARDVRRAIPAVAGDDAVPPRWGGRRGGVAGRSGGRGERASVRGQAAEADEVVGGGDEVAGQAGAGDAPVAGPAEAADGLHPAEDLLDPLPDPLADGIAGVAGRAAVDGAAAVARVLGDVRGHLAAPDGGHAVPGVV